MKSPILGDHHHHHHCTTWRNAMDRKVTIAQTQVRGDGQESHDCTNLGAQDPAGFQPNGRGRWSECFPHHHVSAMERAAAEVRSTSLFECHVVQL